MGAGAPSYYVRAADSEQSWLVSGDLTLSDDSDSWLDKKILELPRERIRAVETLHPDMEEVFVARPSEEVEQFEVHNIPEGSELKYEAVAAGTRPKAATLSLPTDARGVERPSCRVDVPTVSWNNSIPAMVARGLTRSQGRRRRWIRMSCSP